MDDYFNKYIKYKIKYLEIQKNIIQFGGNKIINTKLIQEFTTMPTKSYITFKLNYTVAEKEYIKNININKNNAFDHYGLVSDINITDIENFIKDIGDNDIANCKILSNLINNLCIEICSNYENEKKACWLIIRANEPTTRFEYPRWHLDGKFYNIKIKKNDIQSKFITTLKGSGSLLTETPINIKEELNEISKENVDIFSKAEIERRKKLICLLDKYTKIQLKNNEGAIIIGYNNLENSINYMTIHSEPDITEPRIFISILPGTINEISELASNRGIKLKY